AQLPRDLADDDISHTPGLDLPVRSPATPPAAIARGVEPIVGVVSSRGALVARRARGPRSEELTGAVARRVLRLPRRDRFRSEGRSRRSAQRATRRESP